MSEYLQRALKKETTDLRESQIIAELEQEEESKNSILDAIDISAITPTLNDSQQDNDAVDKTVSMSPNANDKEESTINALQLSPDVVGVKAIDAENENEKAAMSAHPRHLHHHTEPVTPKLQPTYHASMSTLHGYSRVERKSDALAESTLLDHNNNNNEEEDDDNIDFLRIWIQREKQDRDTAEVRNVCRKLQTAGMMRERWVYKDKHGHYPSCLIDDEDICLNINIVQNALPKKSNHVFESKHGVFRVFKLHKKRKRRIHSTTTKQQTDDHIDDDEDEETTTTTVDSEEKEDLYEYIKSENPLFHVHSFGEFMKDLCFLMELIMDGPARTFCYQRLQTLQAKFKLHVLLNENNEASEVRRVPHRDFYNIRKVDNHIHHSACMTQKHLLRFIKSRLKRHGDDKVYRDDKTQQIYTLQQLFHELNLTAYDLSIDTLSMHGHRDTFHRFDRFNRKYNPIGQSSLRQVFLKIDNYAKGKYLADITKEVFDDLKESKYQYSELRLSIYGKKSTEWDILSAWICDNNLHCSNSRWMIQIPRLYSVYRATNMVTDFGAMLDNIFRPLFEVTIDPRSHPKLHLFLNLVTGFDTVDDESIRENTRYEKNGDHDYDAAYPEPSQWSKPENPPYIVWSYYIYANLCVLNQLRESRGMNAFSYRPHSGEAGDADHVAAAYLLAQSINHGLTLKKAPVLQYLYYLKQIGLSMSPLSNNLLFVEYDRNPFQLFFTRGLNVTLSTDDPLIIHYTKDPLIEEYAIAAQVYKLSNIDMCEIARNSLLQSGFPLNQKRHWIGTHTIFRRGVAGNNVKQTNVPDIRLLFRDELLSEEENWILGLPPPIFPSITLNNKSIFGHHNKNKRNSLKKKSKAGYNFLIEHRTKVPLNLQQASSPSPNAAAAANNKLIKQTFANSVSADFDPLGYFKRKQKTQTQKQQTSSSSSRSLFQENRTILTHAQYQQKYNNNSNNNNNQATSKQHYLKSFSFIAIGMLLGYAANAFFSQQYVAANKKNNSNNKQNQ